MVLVVLVRHGERLDEVDAAAWRRMRTEANRNDPPLTPGGVQMSRDAGERLAALIRAEGGGGAAGGRAAQVFSSPTTRTVQTAVQVAVALGVPDITPHHGLNCCAAAKRYGVREMCGPMPEADVLLGLHLSCWPPSGDEAVVNQRHQRANGFVETVLELAANASSLSAASGVPSAAALVLVTHREAIWEIQDAAAATAKARGEAYRPQRQAYCSTEAFDVDPEAGVSAHVWAGAGAAGGAAAAAAAAAPAPAAAPGSLEAVLASGSGEVLFHRGGATRQSTNLWVTPGVRGVWVEGGAVTDGEIVQLLSTPQQSEGEGLFVRVRRAAGHEGWAKLKNIHLPPK